jgi:hypothetical protein
MSLGIRKRIRKLVDRFSGEYSAPAPEKLEEYARPGVPNEKAKVVMARLNRPHGGRAGEEEG